MMNWDLGNYNYRADGIYADKDDAMIFDLKTARKSLLVQMANVYRNRAIGHCLQKNGAYVITNVRWGDERSYSTEFLLENGEKVCLTEKFAFLGAPKKSIISIGTYGCVQSKENKYYFREGLEAICARQISSIISIGLRKSERRSDKWAQVKRVFVSILMEVLARSAILRSFTQSKGNLHNQCEEGIAFV
ncbi:MAG: DUF4417 domain-containing protein [Quinella sp. 1Q7]|nr:DUF4417 domain-containing protein [Quinella sp. 1Q7]